MARLCIYNSAKSVDTAGVAIVHGLTATEATARRSKPVRLFSADGETRFLAYEFIYSGNFASALDVRFFQEFFGDKPSLGAAPNLRVAVGLQSALQWSREVTEEVGNAGAITHNTITRTLSLAADSGSVGTARWLGFAVHAPWVRLAIWINSSVPTGATLAVYAHVGGHLEQAYLETHGDTPYAYNV